jgi:hypothetical protein
MMKIDTTIIIIRTSVLKLDISLKLYGNQRLELAVLVVLVKAQSFTKLT